MDTSPAPGQVVVIGASAGGVQAMLQLAAALPADFALPILLVLHIGAHHSYLPELLARCGPNRAVAARAGDVPRPGTILVAPSDHHMLVDGDGRIRLWRGPKESHARPAINPLFRSAALHHGAGVIGVVLTGMLDDGTAGLKAIKDCGGIAVVQHPADAEASGMPLSALANVDVDHIVRLAELAGLLVRLALADTRRPAVAPPAALRVEHAAVLGETQMDGLQTIAKASAFTCPDCGGCLFELNDPKPVRYICHTGHAIGLRGLAALQGDAAEAALWAGLRALQEKEAVLRRLAAVQAGEQPGSEAAVLREAEAVQQAQAVLRQLARDAPGGAGV